MKKVLITAALMIPMVLALGLGGCLLEDRTVQIVLNSEHCEEFEEDHASASWSTTEIVEIGEDLDILLADNEIELEDIDSVFVVSGTYDVTEFIMTHDWLIGGEITVERTDITSSGPVTLITYDRVSVADEYLSGPQSTPLHSDGVDLVNQALEDYLHNGASPVIELTIVNGEVDPIPDSGDRIEFTWKACLLVQVVADLDVEVVNWLGGS